MSLVIPLLVVPFLITHLTILKIAEMLIDGGAKTKNYLGDEIPSSTGISIVLTIIIVYVFIALFYQPLQMEFLLSLVVVVTVALLGLLDDLVGSRDATGLKGHFSELFKGRLTTGSLKALGTGFIAFAFSLNFSNSIVELVVNTLIISLFTNAVNLLDLRPGRAVKAFLIVSLFFVIYVFISQPVFLRNIFILIPVVGSVTAYFPFDLSGRVMLGDAGSNVLGAVLGISSVLLLLFSLKVGLLVLLILLHIFTEKYSLSSLIEKLKVLRYLDELGR